MQALIGQKYKPIVAPLWLDSGQFDELNSLAAECGLSELTLLDQLYPLDSNCVPRARRRLQPAQPLGQLGRRLQQAPNDARLRKTAADLDQLLAQLEYAARLAAREKPGHPLKVQSALHRLLAKTFSLPTHEHRILSCVRRFEGKTE